MFLFVLPGKWLAKMEEPAARTVIGQRGELRARFSALARFHRRVGPTHISFDPAGVRGVHFNFVVAHLVREMHCEGV